MNPGDMVVVKGDSVKMMKGREAVGTVPNGLKFKVTKVINGWLGAIVEVDGHRLDGWIWHKYVKLEENAKADSPEMLTTEETQARGYRRFSDEQSTEQKHNQ